MMDIFRSVFPFVGALCTGRSFIHLYIFFVIVRFFAAIGKTKKTKLQEAKKEEKYGLEYYYGKSYESV